MSLNFDKAFEVNPEGLIISDDDGNLIAYIASGSDSPVGQSAPINTLYLQGSVEKLWRKVGTGDEDWQLISGFDPLVIDDYQLIPLNQELNVADLEIETTGLLRVDGRALIIRGE